MNPGFMGDLGGVSENAMNMDAHPDQSLMFESILDDLHFNQSNYIIM